MDYQILVSHDSDALAEKVRTAIDGGWHPLGGVSVAVVFESYENERKGYTESSTDYTFTQAMTKLTPNAELTGGFAAKGNQDGK